MKPNSYEWAIRRADCGAGYDFRNSAAKEKRYKVVLYGETWPKYVHLSGCPNGGRDPCPWSPKCQFVMTNKPGQLKDADVVVVTTRDRERIRDVPRTRADGSRGPYRVVYWREAFWPGLPAANQISDFDFEMGIHYRSGLVNPNYLRRPHTLLSASSMFPVLPYEQRTNFALSIISDCNAASQRQAYIDHLNDYLGPHRVHQYGACGNRKLPPPPLQNAAKVIATYKFYLAFENTIQDGYVTEKLLTALNLGILPVYIGAPNVPNITSTPSFVNAMNFRSPKDLAAYLLFLDKNPSEYKKYHAWRENPDQFDLDYLALVARQMPGQEEMRVYRDRGIDKFPRRAECCRLCDENFVSKSAADRDPKRDAVHTKWSVDKINRHLFSGMINRRPGNKGRLEPDAPSGSGGAKPNKGPGKAPAPKPTTPPVVDPVDAVDPVDPVDDDDADDP